MRGKFLCIPVPSQSCENGRWPFLVIFYHRRRLLEEQNGARTYFEIDQILLFDEWYFIKRQWETYVKKYFTHFLKIEWGDTLCNSVHEHTPTHANRHFQRINNWTHSTLYPASSPYSPLLRIIYISMLSITAFGSRLASRTAGKAVSSSVCVASSSLPFSGLVSQSSALYPGILT